MKNSMFHYEGLAADWCSIVRICREGARGGPLYGPHPAHRPFVTPLYGYRNYILAGGGSYRRSTFMFEVCYLNQYLHFSGHSITGSH